MKKHPTLILSGNAHLDFAQNLCQYLDLELGKAEINTFEDGETRVRILASAAGADVYCVQSLQAPSNHHLMELLILIDAAKKSGAKRVTAVIPFCAYARQDRRHVPGMPITAKLIAKLLQTAGADRIVTMDLHAPQMEGFFDIFVENLSSIEVFSGHFSSQTFDAVCTPDTGGIKVAARYADQLKVPLVVVHKYRNDHAHIEAAQLIGDVRDRNVLLVDDMTATGSTLAIAAQLLKNNGARSIHACVTHNLLTQAGYEHLVQAPIDVLWTTNSTPIVTGRNKINTLSVEKTFAETLRHLHNLD